jgi:hypothetical protein
MRWSEVIGLMCKECATKFGMRLVDYRRLRLGKCVVCGCAAFVSEKRNYTLMDKER